ncbi:hypothetical protein OEA41_001618 [Lepraria neglecta]|uniref:N-acetyltransferase domain-containing protein n=1 Tax=Lepraria neglecta TaxID=209136 RepID=A0AAE0DLJ1_9LECA|nr:hypothetical protein OEA41_001618 [Lepraria neglecta]
MSKADSKSSQTPGLYEAAEHKHYGAPADLVDDMGADGITFVTLATTEEQEDPEPIATTGYKSWSDVWKLAARIDGGFTVTDFPQKGKILDDVPRFEIVAVAVDPRFQLHGLASQLLVKATEEIVEVVKVGGASMVRLKVRTIKEINEGYWTKTGFTTLREMRFDVGTAGSSTGFSSLEMFRDHSV